MTPAIETAWRRCAALADRYPGHHAIAALERAAYWLRHTVLPSSPTPEIVEYQRDTIDMACDHVQRARDTCGAVTPELRTAYTAVMRLPREHTPRLIDRAAERIARAAESLA